MILKLRPEIEFESPEIRTKTGRLGITSVEHPAVGELVLYQRAEWVRTQQVLEQVLNDLL